MQKKEWNKQIINKLYQRWDGILFFTLLWMIYLILTLFLFHRQSVGYGGQYISDMPPYIAEMQGIDSGYDFPYPMLFWIGNIFLKVTTPAHAIAFSLTGLNGLCAIILKLFFDNYLKLKNGERKKDYLISVMVFALLFSSMLYPLTYLGKYRIIADGFLYRYLGVFSPNPFHNATYIAARPFAIIAFIYIVDILGFYEKENKWFHRKYVIFSIALLAATLTKPSFTLVLVTTCAVIMIWRLLCSKLKSWKATWQLGIYFIPTFAVLIYQYKDVFIGVESDVEKGIGIEFLKAWETASDNVLISVLLGMAFPLVVLLVQNRKLRSKPVLLFSWQFFAVALVQLLFLYEKGRRMSHVNFAWGYMYGMFFTYTASLLVLMEETKEKSQPKWLLALQWLLFGLHVICGIDYFRVVCSGGLCL